MNCLNYLLPRFLWRVLVNWLSTGGTLSLCLRMHFLCWIWMFFGHFTNRVKSRFSSSAPLILNKGFVTFSWTFFFTATTEPFTPFFGACLKVSIKMKMKTLLKKLWEYDELKKKKLWNETHHCCCGDGECVDVLEQQQRI